MIGLPYWNFLKNSLFVTLSSVIASMLISLLAAIAVARFRFRLRTSYLIMLLIVQMLPPQAMVIALFLDFRSIGLLDNLAGLILVYTAFSIPVTIWMLRNFVAAVPREMEEAAAIDGAGPMRIFWRITAPAGGPRPGGDQRVRVHLRLERVHLRADVPRHRYRQVHAAHLRDVLLRPRHGGLGIDHGLFTLFTLPVLVFFLIVQRRMTNGLMAGAVKG